MPSFAVWTRATGLQRIQSFGLELGIHGPGHLPVIRLAWAAQGQRQEREAQPTFTSRPMASGEVSLPMSAAPHAQGARSTLCCPWGFSKAARQPSLGTNGRIGKLQPMCITVPPRPFESSIMSSSPAARRRQHSCCTDRLHPFIPLHERSMAILRAAPARDTVHSTPASCALPPPVAETYTALFTAILAIHSNEGL